MRIDVFWTDIRFLEMGVGLEDRISAERREKMAALTREGDRKRCLAGGLLLEMAARGRKIERTEQGKPYLPEGPFFNLSHSGDLAVLALSPEVPVGVDVETLQRVLCVEPLARWAFHPEERDFFLEEPGPERFFSLWTRKESYVKMTGEGFFLDPRQFSVLSSEISKRAGFKTWGDLPGYMITVAVEGVGSPGAGLREVRW